MKVYVYEATSADVPAAHRFTARIWCEVIGKKNRPTMDWHPVVFHGADGAALKARAQQWWDDQVAAAKAKAENAARAALARAEAKEGAKRFSAQIGEATA